MRGPELPVRDMLSRIFLPAILLITVLLVVGHVTGSKPRVIHTAPGQVVALASDEQGLVWLATSALPEAGGTAQCALHALPKGADSSTPLFQEERVTEMLPSGDHVLAIAVDGESGSVLSVPRAGGQPTELAANVPLPRGLAEAEGTVFWTETLAPKFGHVYHVPHVRARTVIRSRPLTGGGTATVAALDADPGGFSGELLGVHNGRILWLGRTAQGLSGGWAAIRSAPVAGGAVETHFVLRAGGHDAMLHNGSLYWTAPSEDAGSPLQYRCVRRAPLEGLEPETLTDWLPSGGKLLHARGHVYYVAQDRIWRVPETPGLPVTVPGAKYSGSVATGLGNSIIYASPALEGTGLKRAPVTILGRYAAAVGLGR